MSLESPENYDCHFYRTHLDVAVRGFVALWLGSVLILAAPMILLLAAAVWYVADRTPSVVLLHAWLARIGVAIIMSVCCVDVFSGATAVKQASTHKQWMGLAIAGLFTSIAAFLIWVITVIVLPNTTESMLAIYGQFILD